MPTDAQRKERRLQMESAINRAWMEIAGFVEYEFSEREVRFCKLILKTAFVDGMFLNQSQLRRELMNSLREKQRNQKDGKELAQSRVELPAW